MSALQARFREAWAQALAGANAAEREAGRVLGRITDAAGFMPEDLRRSVRGLAERLQAQRRGIERSVDATVRRAAAKVQLPSKGEVDELRQRVDALSSRLDALDRERQAPAA